MDIARLLQKACLTVVAAATMLLVLFAATGEAPINAAGGDHVERRPHHAAQHAGVIF